MPETPIIPCNHFEKDVGCSMWCKKGDLDCCVLCCKRNTCDDLCPTAKELLKLPEFVNKHYSWESDYCQECGKPHPTGSQIWFECPVDGRWMPATDRCRFKSES